LKKYTLVFAAAYGVMTLALGFLVDATNMKGGGGLNVVATLAGGFGAAHLFARDHGRGPTLEERKRFAWQALLAVWLVSLLLMAATLAFFASPGEVRAVRHMLASGRMLLIGLAAMGFVSLIYFFVIRWSFSWYARKAVPA
jgi:hypothetical protein